MSRSVIRLQGLARSGCVHLLSQYMPYYIVNEYPKCGGTWLGNMLSSALDVPFPRNSFPLLRPSIMHGHYANSWGMHNVVVMWRDGRDISVSWYHHCLFESERTHPSFVVQNRRALKFRDYDDVEANMPAFIEYQFTQQRSPRFSWSDFARSWYGRDGIQYTSYEKLRTDGASELVNIANGLMGGSLNIERARRIVEEYSFERQSGRKPGEEEKFSFLRKGIVGDWKNNFSAEAREMFDHHAGNELILLGYELDHSWVRKADAPN